MNQKWFEMNDIRRKTFDKSVWIPLRAVTCTKSETRYGYEGYKEEFFGCGSIAVPIKDLDVAKALEWSDIGINEHSSCVDEGVYVPAEYHKDHQSDLVGTRLVIDQRAHDDEPSTWHLNQDLVVALGLRREGDSWVCPRDGYTEVARIEFNEAKKPTVLEIKAQYLKDYLCAREMALYMTQFYSRDLIANNASFINWEGGCAASNNETERWEGQIVEIHEGGSLFGSKTAVFHVARTDVEETDDVPDISGIPTDENTKGESWEKKSEGRKLYRVVGELWRNEVIEPGRQSPKVRDDEVPSTVFFTIDADGTKSCGRDLVDAGKWLWFKPEVIMALCHRRGGNLKFHTKNTGSVSGSYSYSVHFGINELGYVNVYAKDIAFLPEWQQLIWAGYNITPEGGISKELFASQVRAEPASTQAPETFLASAIEEINAISNEKLGIRIFREHEILTSLLIRTHRFRAVDEASFYSLAKDLARLIADSLDAEAMQGIVPPPKKTKWGSLKSLENLLASKYDRDFIRKMTASLVGVYELRHADAHLPSSKIDEAFKLIKIDRSQPYVHQGCEMLHQVVSSLYGIVEGLRRWSSESRP